MSQSIFITGIAGSGKSAVCAELTRRGYPAFDIENIDGLFVMIDKQTGLPFDNYDNDDPEKVKRGSWECDRAQLEKLIRQNSDRTAFYAGVASNQEDILPLFDRVILLRAAPNIIRQRLTDRTSNDFARTSEVQDWVLSYKDWWEEKMIAKGAVVIDADGPLVEVVEDIIKRSV